MKLLEENEIQVFNYTASPVVVRGQSTSYVVEGATENGPGMEFISSNDIVYIHSRSPVFKTGLLEFAPDKSETIYEALHVPNWRDTVIFERDIDDMLLNPTTEKLQKIVTINDLPTMERVRGHSIGLINANMDVSSRVARLIQDRFEELTRSPASRSKIQVVKVPVRNDTPSVLELEEMKAEMEAMRKQMDTINASPAKATEPDKGAKTTAAPRKKTVAPRAKTTK